MSLKHQLGWLHTRIPQQMLVCELLEGVTLSRLWDLVSSGCLANALGMASSLVPRAFLASPWRSRLCLSALPPGPKPSLCRAEPHGENQEDQDRLHPYHLQADVCPRALCQQL